MTYGIEYWRDNPDAPFAVLLRVVNTYCHPDSDDYDELKDLAQNPGKYNAADKMHKFKEQLRQAVVDPGQIPHKDALSEAAQFGDGTNQRFLRRLWRDLYTGEPVPGGDDEFRNDLVRIMRGETGVLGTTVSVYTEQYRFTKGTDIEFARMIWQEKYPDEPVPTGG